jgi:hypothetical protein
LYLCAGVFTTLLSFIAWGPLQVLGMESLSPPELGLIFPLGRLWLMAEDGGC